MGWGDKQEGGRKWRESRGKLTVGGRGGAAHPHPPRNRVGRAALTVAPKHRARLRNRCNEGVPRPLPPKTHHAGHPWAKVHAQVRLFFTVSAGGARAMTCKPAIARGTNAAQPKAKRANASWGASTVQKGVAVILEGWCAKTTMMTGAPVRNRQHLKLWTQNGKHYR